MPYFIIDHFRKICFLRKKSPYQSVQVFIGPSLIRRVRVSKMAGKIQFLLIFLYPMFSVPLSRVSVFLYSFGNSPNLWQTALFDSNMLPFAILSIRTSPAFFVDCFYPNLALAGYHTVVFPMPYFFSKVSFDRPVFY